jgi:hypothetical protein
MIREQVCIPKSFVTGQMLDLAPEEVKLLLFISAGVGHWVEISDPSWVENAPKWIRSLAKRGLIVFRKKRGGHECTVNTEYSAAEPLQMKLERPAVDVGEEMVKRLEKEFIIETGLQRPRTATSSEWAEYQKTWYKPLRAILDATLRDSPNKALRKAIWAVRESCRDGANDFTVWAPVAIQKIALGKLTQKYQQKRIPM